jgi:hypothetical protein
MKFRDAMAPYGSSRDGADRSVALAREIDREYEPGDTGVTGLRE